MSGVSPNSPRSWPAQKPRPAPVRTTARTSASRASLTASSSSRLVGASRAFRTSGRLSVIVWTAPSRVTSTSGTPETLTLVLASPRGTDLHLGRARRLLAGRHDRCRASVAVGRQHPRAAWLGQRRRDQRRRLHADLGARRRPLVARPGVVHGRPRVHLS